MKTPKEIYLLQKGSQLLGTWSGTPQKDISGGCYSAEYKYIRADLVERKPAEWSEEEKMHLANAILAAEKEWGINSCTANFLKSLRPQPKQESEPLEIKFAEKIYKVYGTKELPDGVVGYIIEDEPGHYDCIIHPDEVLGGGYGIKSNGSPYPTKEANFGQPHWKPSEEQMWALDVALENFYDQNDRAALKSLRTDLQKLL